MMMSIDKESLDRRGPLIISTTGVRLPGRIVRSASRFPFDLFAGVPGRGSQRAAADLAYP